MTKNQASPAAADFQINQHVVYPAHGVGKILGIEDRSIEGVILNCYVISFENEKLTLWVPIKRRVAGGLRTLSSTEVISAVMETLRQSPQVKREKWDKRKQKYVQKINSGDLLSIAEVVRDLHPAEDQLEQAYSEIILYTIALERLTREVAAVMELNDAEAADQVASALAAKKITVSKSIAPVDPEKSKKLGAKKRARVPATSLSAAR